MNWSVHAQASGARHRSAKLGAPATEQYEVALAWSDPTAGQHLPHSVRAIVAGPAGAPLLVVLGGISSTADVVVDDSGHPGWWNALFGPHSPVGSRRYRILGIDFAADNEGRFAPTPRDQADIIHAALVAIGEDEPFAVVGASYGGMVAMAYAERFQPSSARFVIISADAAPHPSATALRSMQRRIVDLGRRFDCVGPALAIARGVAMIAYRTPTEFKQRFKGGIASSDPIGASEPGDYLVARGDAFVNHMAPGRFLSLSASIDRHFCDVSNICSPALIIGITEDQLVPLSGVRQMWRTWGGPAGLKSLSSIYGHDAFLKEAVLLAPLLCEFLECDVR